LRRYCVLTLSAAWCGLAFACNDSTGGGLVTFPAYVTGPELDNPGRPYAFDSTAGYHIELERAQLRVGALYLNRARPSLGAAESPCVQSGIYVAEVTSAAVLDVLSVQRVRFATSGTGTADRALSGEVWLTGDRVDAERDSTRILDVSGTAQRGAARFGFYGAITISDNRKTTAADPALPGANPLCKQRIVTPIPVDITPANHGALLLRVDPRPWFAQVDFASLPGAVGNGESLEIPDDNENIASLALFQGLRTLGAYAFEWVAE
jgi:hypothetical protein